MALLTLKMCFHKLAFCGLLTVYISSCTERFTPLEPPDFYGFGTDEKGWRITGGLLTFSDTAGNPGGYIGGSDDHKAIPFWYFIAPQPFVSDVQKGYGRTLRFDLKQSATDSQFEADDLILTDGKCKLTFNTAYNPKTTWTSYSIKLDEFSGWKKGKSKATKADMQRVLQNLIELKIRGEFRAGPDWGGLDNVSID